VASVANGGIANEKKKKQDALKQKIGFFIKFGGEKQ